MRRIGLIVCMGMLGVCLAGCAITSAQRARNTAAAMLAPDTTPLQRLKLRQRLLELGAAADPYLADAFFPIGLYDVPEDALHEIAAAGFNLVVNGRTDTGYLRRASAASLKVIPYINTKQIARDVKRVGNNPTVPAWYLWDEPDLNKLAPDDYRALAKNLRAQDHTRPIYLTVWAPSRYEDYVDACDIFAPNPYPIQHLEAAENRLRIVSRTVDLARAAADNRPVWAILQTFWAEPHWPRNPTPEELRAMVFLALNHGADGIIYFSYKSGDRPLTQHHSLFAEIKRINGQIHALRGALLKRPVPREAIEDKLHATFTDAGIDYSVRRFGGATLFIAVNPDPVAVTAAFDFAVLGATKPARELFLPMPLDASPPTPGQKTPLRFQPFEVKLFWIE